MTEHLDPVIATLHSMLREIAVREIAIETHRTAVTCEVTVLPHPDDIGRIIGPKGFMFRAIKNYLDLVSGKMIYDLLRIPEPLGEKSKTRLPKDGGDEWRERIQGILASMASLIFNNSEVDVQFRTAEQDGPKSPVTFYIHVSASESLRRTILAGEAFLTMIEGAGRKGGVEARVYVVSDGINQPENKGRFCPAIE